MAEIVDGGKIKLESGKIITPKQGEWYDGQHFIDGSLGGKGIVNDPNAVGYGKKVSDEVNLQSDAAAGYSPGTIKEYLNLGTVPEFTSARDAAKFANATGSQLSGVQSRDEIRASLESELNLPDRPEVPSLLETFKTQKTEAGLDTLQEEINTLTAQERELIAEDRQRKANEKSKPEALGVIAGRVTEIERQSAERLDVIQRQKAYKIDQYNSALTSIQMIMQFTQQDYENASADFNSQFTQGLQMIDAISGIQRDQKTDQQRRIDNANATLSVMMNAITSGNLSYSSLSADQKLNISKMEAQAGLPVGFVANLKLSPSDKILNINNETGEVLMVDESGNFQVKKTGMTISSGKMTESEKNTQKQAYVIEAFNAVKGQDGYVDPKDWDAALDRWLIDGGTTSSFVSNFKKFANPNNNYSGVEQTKSVTLNL